MFAIKLALAGMGHLIAHWSIGLIVIAICLVLEFGSGWVIGYLPVLQKPIVWLQKYLLLIAIGTGLILFGEWLGAKDMVARCDARAAVVEKEVHGVVKNADKALDPNANAVQPKDKWDTDQ